MYPAAFDYYRPDSVPEAIKLLQEHPDGKLIAGGYSLLPMMKLRLAQPAALIDLGRVPGLSGVEDAGGHVVIGARTTYWELMQSPVIREALPIIAEAANVIGDIQVRNRGTLGGSLAHSDPASDMPAVVLALDATITAVGPNGEREIKATDFFVDLFETALAPDEVVTKITIAKPAANTGMAYEKFAHPASGYAVVAAAAVVTLNGGNASAVRVAVTGAGPKAYRASGVEQALAGQALGEDAVKAASAHATDGIELNGDIFAAPDYRGHLTQVFVERAIARAAEAARG